MQGDQQLIEQPQERKYDGAKGWVTSRRWRGTIDAVNSQAANLVREFGSRCNLTVNPDEAGLATLSASFDGVQDGEKKETKDTGEPVADSESWTLAGNDLSKSIYSSPALTTLLADYPADYDWLRVNIPIVKKNGTWQQVYAALTGAEAGGTLKPIFKLFMDGVEEFSVSQFVLKLQRTIASGSKGRVSLANAGRQFTTAELISAEGVPSDLLFAVPDGAWLKRTPTISYDGQKLSFDVEWWHADEWTTILYPAFDPASQPPVMTIGAAFNITDSSAMFAGSVDFGGGSPVTEYGLAYSSAAVPTTLENPPDSNDGYVAVGAGTGDFTAAIDGLFGSTDYFVNAYCVNGEGTFFSGAVQFSTL